MSISDMRFNGLVSFDSEESLLELVQQEVPESIGLEYKGGDLGGSRNLVLSKAVSAFANSQGGVLLIGISEGYKEIPDSKGKEKVKIPVDIEGVDPTKLTRETIDNIMLSNIQPPVRNVEITRIELTGRSARRVVYQIKVPVSDSAPHMAGKMYYKRTSTGSYPMEHYEVEDIRNRSKGPDIETELLFLPNGASNSLLTAVIQNKSRVTANHALLRIVLGSEFQVIHKGQFDHEQIDMRLQIGNESFLLTQMLVFKVNSYSGQMPLWENLPFRTGRAVELKFSSSMSESVHSQHVVISRLDSPDMKPKIRVNRLLLVNGTVKLGDEIRFETSVLEKAWS